MPRDQARAVLVELLSRFVEQRPTTLLEQVGNPEGGRVRCDLCGDCAERVGLGDRWVLVDWSPDVPEEFLWTLFDEGGGGRAQLCAECAALSGRTADRCGGP
jgi:hypothetical protein